MSKGLVLVTGVTGYIGAHVARELLLNGYSVRGTVRNLNKKKGTEHLERWKEQGLPLELFQASLLDPEPWMDACKDVDYVMHVASPFVVGVKEKHAQEKLHKPAVEGTLNVLKAAQASSVKRVVLTSSIGAIYGGNDRSMFDGGEYESIWTDVDAKGLDHYLISKTNAERAAWDFYEEHKDDGFELVAINPGMVLGPPVSTGSASSHEFISRLLGSGFMPMVPDLHTNTVDVRDVAKAHRRAIEVEEASGERFGCTSYNDFSFVFYAKVLKQEFRKYGYRFTTTKAPDILVRLLSYVDSDLRGARNEIGITAPSYNNRKIKEVLGMNFIPIEQTIIEHGHGCIQLGVQGCKMTQTYRKAFEAGEIEKTDR